MLQRLVLAPVFSLAITAATLAGTPAAAQPSAAQPAAVADRWHDDFAAFAAQDAARKPQPGGVVFVGSSSIRLWDDLEQQFERLPVIVKRGFGGSRLADCTAHLERLVLAYQPRAVVLYAGENDLAEGASPQDVLRQFRTFVDGVRRAQPQVHIAYLSIKPSPSRAALLPRIREANALIAAEIASLPDVQYIDVHRLMLDGSGAPRAELFRDDRLHLNAAGYALWRREIAARLP